MVRLYSQCSVEHSFFALAHISWQISEERINEHLWRSAINGSESHTSALDEFNIRQLLCRDTVEALERVSEKDKNVPLPSIGTPRLFPGAKLSVGSGCGGLIPTLLSQVGSVPICP